MNTYSFTHDSARVLLHDLKVGVGRESAEMAGVLARIAEVDARRLYVPEGYPSMYAYCVGELGYTEQAALKRIKAGRVARRFPAIFVALAEGRLHLSGVLMLGPYLTEETADDLLAAVARKSMSEIEQLLAELQDDPVVVPGVRVLDRRQLLLGHLPAGRFHQCPMQAKLAIARLLDRVDLRPQVVGAQEVVGDPQPSCGIAF